MLKGVSMGDYLYYRAGGPKEVLGGYRTGSMAGTGMATFGWWYMLLLGVGMVPIFFVFDQFCSKKFIKSAAHKSGYTVETTFSLCGMLVLDSVFRFLPAESVATIAVYLMRDCIQLVILYLLIFHVTKIFNFIFLKRGSMVSS